MAIKSSVPNWGLSIGLKTQRTAHSLIKIICFENSATNFAESGPHSGVSFIPFSKFFHLFLIIELRTFDIPFFDKSEIPCILQLENAFVGLHKRISVKNMTGKILGSISKLFVPFGSQEKSQRIHHFPLFFSNPDTPLEV